MLKNYIKIAFKVMMRRKFFTGVSLFGISFTLLVLLIVTAFIDNEVGSKMVEPSVDRNLYVVVTHTGNDDTESYHLSTPTYYFCDNYIKSLKIPENVGLFSWGNRSTEYVEDRKLEVDYRYTDANFWDIYQFDFLKGKPYTNQDLDNANNVVVLNQDIALQYFGDKEPIGEYVTIRRKRFRVVGVVANVPYKEWTRGPESKVWIPYTAIRQDYKKTELRPSFAPGFNAVIQAKKGSDIAKIKAELADKLSKINFTDPKHISWLQADALTRKEMMAFSSNFMFDGDDISKQNRPHASVTRFYLWMAALALLFMAMPAINLMNLNSSRIMERSSEIGVRKAFGASSNTLVGQFITENIIVTLVGAAFGYLLAYFVLDAINSSGFIPYSILTVNTKVFLYGLLISIFFGFLSGVYPAYRMSRLHPASALKEGT